MTMDGYLLVSDVDDTLVGDAEALGAFARWLDGVRPRLRVAYASGRFAASIRRTVEETELPVPVAVIGGVGTEILLYQEGRSLPGWPQLSGEWDPDHVREVLAEATSPGAASPVASPLRPQPEASQSPFKVSYTLEDASDEQLAALRECLEDVSIAADVIYSSRRDLDVVPRGVNKGSAAAFLAAALEVPGERVLVSGNSANDAALFRTPFRGIVVGNAHDELKALAGDRVYVSPETFARGVLDGIRHWTGLDGDDA
jgi:sucrose-6F-phosphate phosphohydrolase